MPFDQSFLGLGVALEVEPEALALPLLPALAVSDLLSDLLSVAGFFSEEAASPSGALLFGA